MLRRPTPGADTDHTQASPIRNEPHDNSDEANATRHRDLLQAKKLSAF